jgi:hypothetical protein
MEGHNWFSSLFVEIPRRSIIAGFITLLEKNRFKPYTVRDQLFMTTGSELKTQSASNAANLYGGMLATLLHPCLGDQTLATARSKRKMRE